MAMNPAKRRTLLAASLVLFALAVWLFFRLPSARVLEDSPSPSEQTSTKSGLEVPVPVTGSRAVPEEPTEALPAPDPDPILRMGTFRFVDAMTDAPLPGVAVHEYEQSRKVATHTSDARGEVALDLVLCLERVFDFRLDGYRGRALGERQFEALAENGVVTVRLQPAGTVQVQVNLADGTPVEKVYVEVHLWDSARKRRANFQAGWTSFNHPASPYGGPESLRAWTDASGFLAVPEMPVETDLIVSVDYRVAPDFQIVRIPLATRTVDARFVGNLGHAVRGRLIAEDDSPLPRAKFEIQDAQERSYRYPYVQAITASDGSFAVELLPDGPMILDLARLGAESLPFTIDGADVDLGDIRVGGAVVSVRLLPEQGWKERDPTLLHRIQLTAEHGGRVLQTLAFRQGAYTGKLRRGPVDLVVRDGYGELARVPVVVPVFDVEIPIASGLGSVLFSLNGVPEGTPVRVTLRPLVDGLPQGHGGRWSTSDAVPRLAWQAGRVSLRGVAPGAHLLGIEVPERGSADSQAVVVARQETDLGALAIGFGGLEVRVVDPGGAAVPGTAVLLEHLASGTPGRQVVKSDAQGRCMVPRAHAGAWRASILGEREGGTVAAVATRVSAGETALVQLTCACDSRLEISVLDGDAPIVGAQVELLSLAGLTEGWTQGNRIEIGTTDSQGSIEFPNLASGNCLVKVRAEIPPFGITNRNVETRIVPGAQSLVIRWSSKGRPVRILADGEPFTDIRFVSALGPGFSDVGTLLDPEAGLVAFPTCTDVEYFKIRVASTTGKELHGNGGSYLFARLQGNRDAAELTAEICEGRLSMELSEGAMFPALGVEHAPGLAVLAWGTNHCNLRWSDEAGSRSYFGFPEDASLSVIPFGATPARPHAILETRGVASVVWP